jgi:hypothetical protein
MMLPEPAVVWVERRNVNPDQYLGTMATEDDYATLITTSTMLYDRADQRAVVAYILLEDDLSRLVEALLTVPTAYSDRQSGLMTNSATFGYEPRNPVRHDYCTAAHLARKRLHAYHLLTATAGLVARAYAWYDPDRYAHASDAVARVLPEWRLAETAFTSGVVNRDSALAYHTDTGNFKGVWSAMLGFRHNLQGGYLALPEYGVALEIANNSLTMFDGQRLIHGVTPFRRLGGDAYRMTVVYYGREGMWRCLTNQEEIKQARQRRAARKGG